MGIYASFELQPDAVLSVDGKELISKAIATFVQAVGNYRIDRHEAQDVEQVAVSSREIVEWFARVTREMRRDITLLDDAMAAFWTYTEGQYEAYAIDWKAYLRESHPDGPRTMTKEEFLQTCREIEATWTDINLMRDTVDELVTVLEKTRPPDTWWYCEEYTLPDFRLLSRGLTEASAQGHTRVRIFCS